MIKIGRAGALAVYPIGLIKVPGDSGSQTANPPPKPELIEDLIVIS